MKLVRAESPTSFGRELGRWMTRSIGTGALLTVTGVGGVAALIAGLWVPAWMLDAMPGLSSSLAGLVAVWTVGPLLVVVPALRLLTRLVDRAERVLTAPTVVSAGTHERSWGQLSVAGSASEDGRVSLGPQCDK